MIDGLDPSYATPGVMPELHRLGAAGMSTLVDAVAPTVTNANNAGISCAAWPSEYGITGNYHYDPATASEDYMERPELLLRPTLMTRIADAGATAGSSREPARDTRVAFATDRAYLRKPGPTGATTL
jgi:phosphonoacetate hydrolase